MPRRRGERRGVGGKKRGREGERNVEGAKGEVGRGQVSQAREKFRDQSTLKFNLHDCSSKKATGLL